jgi:hypothetical protein
MMTLAPKLTEILTFKYVLHPDVLLLFELEQCTAGGSTQNFFGRTEKF